MTTTPTPQGLPHAARHTDERELTEPVDLTVAGGRSLNPDAVGWSRTPLHRARLQGAWGRNKRWDYWAILAGDLVVSTVYANVDYLGLADVWWLDLASGRTGGKGIASPLGAGIALPDTPGATPLRAQRKHFDLSISDDQDGTTNISAQWKERDGSKGSLDAAVALPAGHESLNVVIPWSDDRFQYTSKHQARPVTGTLEVGDDRWVIEDAPGGAWGVLDVGRGRWPYRTRWNWGGGAGEVGADGTVVGIQIGGRWTEGTGHTENGVIVDGRLTKIGDELMWRYDWDAPMQPWAVSSHDGGLALLLEPLHDKHTKVNVGVLRMETHQVFGTWSGHVTDDTGRTIRFDGLQGFAEESRSRW